MTKIRSYKDYAIQQANVDILIFKTKLKQYMYCLDNRITFCFLKYICIFIYVINKNLVHFYGVS